MSIPWFGRDARLLRLVGRARAGDPRAFASLYEELYEPVARFISRRVAGADAEDLTSKVFFRLLEQLSAFDPSRAKVMTWVLAIARNAVIDFYRARRTAVPVDELAEVLADGAQGPLEALVRGEAERAAAEALARLPGE